MRNFIIKKLIFWHYLIIVLVLAGIVLAGTHFLGDGYTSLTINRGIAHFSFEYPEQYKGYFWAKLYGGQKHPEAAFETTNIILRGPDRPKVLPERAVISISVWPSYYSSAEDAAKKLLDVYKKDQNFQIIDQSLVTISGKDGYRVIYYYTRTTFGPPIPIGQEPPPPTVDLSREVFFITDDLLWDIRIFSPQDMAEATEADFEHILKTFKILD